ncbi:hypothetical protein GCM10007416_33370 [Kroppenstedtia guangzhouensis]|uniref:Uncharacterized protein n=1 Tax=Kroppenstedtia guangzhouensis TaxID=1274356 RepID=A0ABQ1H3N2_9BACL|nr:hypothetical protein GCM10007416_33370 [Kroppenstedtia guangzhouensis]
MKPRLAVDEQELHRVSTGKINQPRNFRILRLACLCPLGYFFILDGRDYD